MLHPLYKILLLWDESQENTPAEGPAPCFEKLSSEGEVFDLIRVEWINEVDFKLVSAERHLL